MGSINHPQWRSYQSINWQSPVNWSHSLNKRLLAWWKVVPHWKGGTVLRNLVNGKNNGTLTNMDPSSDWVTPGERSGGWGALDFDGTDDFVDCGNIGLNASNPFTWSLWYNYDGGPASANGDYLISYDDISGNEWLALAFDSSERIKVFSNGKTPGETDDASPFNIFQHVAMVWDGTGFRIYKQGIFDETLTPSSTDFLSGLDNLSIGDSQQGGGDPVSAKLDDIRIHDRALSDKEIFEYYILSRNFYPGLFNYWRPRKGLVTAVPPVTDILDLERGIYRGVNRGVLEGV